MPLRAAAALPLADLRRDEERRLDDALARERAAPPVDQLRALRRADAPGQMIGEAEQHAALDGAGRRRLLARVEFLFCGDAEELLEQGADLARRLGAHARAAAALAV